MARASELLKVARSWVGKNEADGSHMDIINIYNSQKKLPRGYKVKSTDSWCATTISALAIECNATDIIPVECSCQKMIELCKAKGIWEENESLIPNVGWILFYDWQDDGKGDCKGWADHVGIVDRVDLERDMIVVIEGNKNNAVSYVGVPINGKTLRGFAVPEYDPEPVSKPTSKKEVLYNMKTLKKGSKGNQVTIFETLMKEAGYYDGKIDDNFGNGCVKACNAFQKDYPECGTNGKPDSSWGKKCWNKLLSLFGA